MSEHTGPRLLPAVRIAAASAMGSLAAVVAVGLVLGRQIRQPQVVDAVAVLIAALCVVAAITISSDVEKSSASRLAFTRPSEAPGRVLRAYAQHGPEPTRRPGTGPDQSSGTGLPPLATSVTPTSVGLTLARDPVPGRTAQGLPWHEAAGLGVAGTAGRVEHASAPTPPPAADASTAAVRNGPPQHQEIRLGPPASARDVRRVVQCPRCGSFSIHAVQVRAGCTFDCQDCGHPWHWRRGTPWPVTVTRPRLRRLDQARPTPAPAVWRLQS